MMCGNRTSSAASEWGAEKADEPGTLPVDSYFGRREQGSTGYLVEPAHGLCNKVAACEKSKGEGEGDTMAHEGRGDTEQEKKGRTGHQTADTEYA